MIFDPENKEVRYDKYCIKCIRWNNGKETPECDECLEESTRYGTEKPLRFEEA